jgi:hypothetical protein
MEFAVADSITPRTRSGVPVAAKRCRRGKGGDCDRKAEKALRAHVYPFGGYRLLVITPFEVAYAHRGKIIWAASLARPIFLQKKHSPS